MSQKREREDDCVEQDSPSPKVSNHEEGSSVSFMPADPYDGRIGDLVRRYNFLKTSTVPVADPLFPRMLKWVVRKTTLSQVTPDVWEEMESSIPIFLMRYVMECLPFETIEYLADRDPSVSTCEYHFPSALIREAMRRGRDEDFFRESTMTNATRDDLMDAYHGKSEAIIDHIKKTLYEDMDVPFVYLREATRGGNLEHVKKELSSFEMINDRQTFEDNKRDYFLEAIISGSIDVVRAYPLDDDWCTMDELFPAVVMGKKEIVQYILDHFDHSSMPADEVCMGIIQAFPNHDKAHILQMIFNAFPVAVTFKMLKRAIKFGLVNCLRLLLHKYEPTAEEKTILIDKIQYGSTFLVLFDLPGFEVVPLQTTMDAEDIWLYLEWIQKTEGIVCPSRLSFFLQLMNCATGDSEFTRLRDVVRGYYISSE
jgi:hypothetical protein